MLRFRQFLKEYLTDVQRERYSDVEMTPEARDATDHFFGVGNDQVREELKGFEADKSETHRKIEKHLGQDISHEDYRKGTTADKFGRQVKLGKLIKDQQLRYEFNRDNTRAGVKKAVSHYVTVVRGTEVAGQTNSAPDPAHPKGHSWGSLSCKNVDTGSNRHYLKPEIKHGTVVVRVHDHNDQEIYRATLHPHLNELGDRAYNLESEYGVKHPSFTEHAHDVAARLSGEFKPVTFTKHPGVYNDSGKTTMIHPAASAENLHDIISQAHPREIIGILNHRNADRTHVEHVLQEPSFHKDRYALFDAINSKAVSKDQIDSIFKKDNRYAFNRDDDTNADMRLHILKHIRDSRVSPEHIEREISHPYGGSWMEAAVGHPSATYDQIRRGLNHSNEYVRLAAASNPSLSPKHVDEVISDPSKEKALKKAVLFHPTAVTAAHIDKVLKTPYPEDHMEKLRLTDLKHDVASRRQLNPQHIDWVLNNEPEHLVRAAAVRSDNMTPALVSKALEDPAYQVRRSAIRRTTAVTSEHIDKALDDENYKVREMAITHPTAVTSEHIDKALEDSTGLIRRTALDHPQASVDHIIKGLHDKNQDVASRAYQRGYDMALKTQNDNDRKRLHDALFHASTYGES